MKGKFTCIFIYSVPSSPFTVFGNSGIYNSVLCDIFKADELSHGSESAINEHQMIRNGQEQFVICVPFTSFLLKHPLNSSHMWNRPTPFVAPLCNSNSCLLAYDLVIV
jgi:hypothetical protein